VHLIFFSSSLNLNFNSVEEMLLDFQEIVGEHSSENMASIVWDTLKMYEIEDKVSEITHFACFSLIYFYNRSRLSILIMQLITTHLWRESSVDVQ
jgi:hypothetical protein